jgi:2-iminobutanoate/2-iminopropanoate deaminase
MPKEIIYSQKAPEAIGPYSQAVRTGNMLFVSGQIAIEKASGSILTHDIKLETKQVMINLEYILKEADLNFSHVVKCNIYLKNMSDFPKVNEVYGSFFTENPPARETVEVSGLPKGVNVEISCIAVV